MAELGVIESGCLPEGTIMPAIPMSSAQIVEDITARIRAGEWRPGDRLPSYNELAELYSVRFGTIARVILILKERRLVVGVPGKGTFVAEEPPGEEDVR